MAVSLQDIRNQLLYIPEDFPPGKFYLYCLVYIIFVLWGIYFIFENHYSAILNQSFMHSINLVFHEAGHVIFRLLGHFMSILGGSLMQLIVPAVFMIAFIRKLDNVAASIMLWWLAQSMMDLVAYIDDAQRQTMWLLGGIRGKDMPGIHDWNNILGQLGMLEYSHALAVLTSWSAIAIMLLSFYWGGYLLMQIKRQLY